MHFITSPTAARAPQCSPLSAVISGSLRIASLSFTLGSISMSLEGISKASGGNLGRHYIIQAPSSRPGPYLHGRQSQASHSLQLNRHAPCPKMLLGTDSSTSRPVEQDIADLSNIAEPPGGQDDKRRKQVYPNHQREDMSIWATQFPFAIIQDGRRCEKSPNDFRAPGDKPAMHLESYGGWRVWDISLSKQRSRAAMWRPATS